MNIDVTEIIALFAQLAGPAFSVAFVFGFGAKLVHSFLSMGLDKLFEYIQAGTGILNFFIPFDLIRPAIDVFLAVWAIEHAYQLVLWVLRKVPILGIK